MIVNDEYHCMRLAVEPFRMIKSGEKTVEVRLYDEKRQGIKCGDFIEFTCTDGGDTLTVKVKGVRRFNTFVELYESDLFDKTGSQGYTPEQAALSMYKYYTPEQEKQYGVLAIEIELMQN